MVTRSSLVWVMTGIAAGIAGGWLWNRERGLDVAPPVASENRSEPVRSPFAQRREERGTYLESPRPTSHTRPERAAAPRRNSRIVNPSTRKQAAQTARSSMP